MAVGQLRVDFADAHTFDSSPLDSSGQTAYIVRYEGGGENSRLCFLKDDRGDLDAEICDATQSGFAICSIFNFQTYDGIGVCSSDGSLIENAGCEWTSLINILEGKRCKQIGVYGGASRAPFMLNGEKAFFDKKGIFEFKDEDFNIVINRLGFVNESFKAEDSPIYIDYVEKEA